MGRYLVELERPVEGWSALQAASARVRRSAAEIEAEGSPVRFLRSVYVPEDDTCFFLFEAGSPVLVDEVGRRAEVGLRRVAEPLSALGPAADTGVERSVLTESRGGGGKA